MLFADVVTAMSKEELENYVYRLQEDKLKEGRLIGTLLEQNRLMRQLIQMDQDFEEMMVCRSAMITETYKYEAKMEKKYSKNDGFFVEGENACTCECKKVTDPLEVSKVLWDE